MFEPNVLKLVIKTIFINSSSFAFLIINIKILIYNSLEGMVHIWFLKKHFKKIKIIHFQGLNALNMQKHFLFVSNFEHVKFTIMKNIPKTFMIIQTIMIPL